MFAPTAALYIAQEQVESSGSQTTNYTPFQEKWPPDWVLWVLGAVAVVVIAVFVSVVLL
jgi:hypothetical protein